MGWTNQDEQNLQRQRRETSSKAQAQWASENPVKSGCFTLFALLFLGGLALLVGLGMMGFFDNL